jgi:hypothetical protein
MRVAAKMISSNLSEIPSRLNGKESWQKFPDLEVFNPIM